MSEAVISDREITPISNCAGCELEALNTDLEGSRQGQGVAEQPAAFAGAPSLVLSPAQMELQQALEWRRSIFQGSRDAIFISNAESRLVDVNEAACAMTGYTRAELLRLGISDLHEGNDQESCRVCQQRILSGQEVLCETEILRRDGGRVEVELSNRRVEIQGSIYIHAAARDISARRCAQRALRESEELMRALLENCSDGILMVRPGGEIYYASRGVKRILGYSPEETLGRSAYDFVHPEDRERVQQARESSPPGVPVALQLRALHKNGSWRYLESVGVNRHSDPAIGGLIVDFRDVTDRRRAEEALRHSEAWFRALVENCSDAILVINEDGQIRYSSGVTEKILGFKPEELVGRNAAELIHPEDLPTVHRANREVAAHPGVSVTIEIRMLQKSGGYRHIQSAGVNRYADPLLGALVIAFRDNTERKRLEQQLRDSQKMEAVARLVGGLSHDFNNLLTAITLYADLLLESLPAATRQRRYGDEVRMAAMRGTALVRQLLAFARQQVMESKVLSLNAVIAGMTDLLKRSVGEDVQLVLELQSGLGNVRVDPMQMQQVVMNLAFNARDAMPHGGKLAIRTAMVEHSETHNEGPSRSAWVSLEVSDTGFGMDEKTRAHIFEPFFTTKERGKGTGLGLSMVYGIVAQSGGSISVDSELGQGTRVMVLLPEVTEELDVVPEPPVAGGPARGCETILLVEDNAPVRNSIRQLLDECGYAVLEAGNGPQGLALAKQHSGDIHLLISDMVMPNMDGCELAAELAVLHPEARVLFISGYHQGSKDPPGDEMVCRKPFTREELAEKVRATLDLAVRPKIL